MIDVHMIVAGEQPWIAEARASVTWPHVLHELAPHPCGVSAGRWAGFALGSSDLVSFIDPDDVLTVGALDACEDTLRSFSSRMMAYADEEQIDADGAVLGAPHVVPSQSGPATLAEVLRSPTRVHHPLVFRRSFVDAHGWMVEALPRGFQWALACEAIARGAAVHVPMIGYQWRRHLRQMSREPDPQMADCARWLRERHI